MLAFLAALACRVGNDVPANSDGDCLTDDEEETLGTDVLVDDTDGDGLDDCAEVRDYGSDPLAVDGDGDGVSDPEEVACVSDPADGDEVCYACGWPHADPGTFTTNGSAVGDVVADMTLWDQCVEPVSLYDLAGTYRLLFDTTLWCVACITEAKALDEEVAAISQTTDVPVEPIIALFEDVYGDPPAPEHGRDYADAYDIAGFPVVSDVAQDTTTVLPHDGTELPAKCVLNPEMVILGCYLGAGGTEEITQWIEADAAR